MLKIQPSEEVMDICRLRENQSRSLVLNLDTQKIVKGAEILQRKGGLQVVNKGLQDLIVRTNKN